MNKFATNVWSLVSSVRVRAFLSLGIVAGIGAVGTTAYWTDNATLQGGSFTSGSIDLRLDAATNTTTDGTGGTYSPVGFTVSNLIPGESYAWAVKVSNSGVTPLTYKVSGLATGALNGAVQFAVYDGAQDATTPATNTGSALLGTRTGSCTGGTPAPTQTFTAALLDTSKTVVSTARPLLASAAEWMCVVASLPLATDNSFQTKTTSAAFSFTAAQVGVTLP
ncbi:SipW-dependent-type signal peptide-containing protein [Nocardioides sp. LS1]|uniref:SipW-dependent-type signal peptide-containing protein n=1 Tax=Nocardioides sp. LS1 TaxID=1027620 RepID=UPI000F61F81D|nr:SipW-dependent-type signal peptide-containing protein [Nocardioides sp. LS1]GCD88797.1 hypothetical protein NLS1_08030 [Nocardioides sp. LS1]